MARSEETADTASDVGANLRREPLPRFQYQYTLLYVVALSDYGWPNVGECGCTFSVRSHLEAVGTESGGGRRRRRGLGGCVAASG